MRLHAFLTSAYATAVVPLDVMAPELIEMSPDPDAGHRWTTYDATFFGIDLPNGVPPIHQERAFKSPV